MYIIIIMWSWVLQQPAKLRADYPEVEFSVGMVMKHKRSVLFVTQVSVSCVHHFFMLVAFI